MQADRIFCAMLFVCLGFFLSSYMSVNILIHYFVLWNYSSQYSCYSYCSYFIAHVRIFGLDLLSTAQLLFSYHYPCFRIFGQVLILGTALLLFSLHCPCLGLFCQDLTISNAQLLFSFHCPCLGLYGPDIILSTA